MMVVIIIVIIIIGHTCERGMVGGKRRKLRGEED
jgi:hypothetical protein